MSTFKESFETIRPTMNKFTLELSKEQYQSFKEIMKRVAYMPDSVLSPYDGDTAQEVLKQLAGNGDKTVILGHFGYTFLSDRLPG